MGFELNEFLVSICWFGYLALCFDFIEMTSFHGLLAVPFVILFWVKRHFGRLIWQK